MAKIKVVIKYPGEDAREAMIENELETLQKIVRGHIEVVPFAGDLLLIVNEEGKLQNMAPNIIVLQSGGYDVIRGPVIVAKAGGEEFVSLEEKDVKKALMVLNRRTGEGAKKVLATMNLMTVPGPLSRGEGLS